MLNYEHQFLKTKEQLDHAERIYGILTGKTEKMHRSTQNTVTPDCYQKGEARLNQWLKEIHNNGRAADSEKKKAEQKYNQLFINKFRNDGK